MKWAEVVLGDACSKIGSGATPKGGSAVYIEKGTSLIRSQNVYNLRFSYDGLAHITEDAAQKLNGVTIEEQDVLINITGDSVARTCVVPADVLPARVNQHVAIIRPKKQVFNPYFLNYYLASPYMQAYMLGLAVGKGASRNAMTKDMIAGFKIPCPPVDVQEAVVGDPMTLLLQYLIDVTPHLKAAWGIASIALAIIWAASIEPGLQMSRFPTILKVVCIAGILFAALCPSADFLRSLQP